MWFLSEYLPCNTLTFTAQTHPGVKETMFRLISLYGFNQVRDVQEQQIGRPCTALNSLFLDAVRWKTHGYSE